MRIWITVGFDGYFNPNKFKNDLFKKLEGLDLSYVLINSKVFSRFIKKFVLEWIKENYGISNQSSVKIELSDSDNYNPEYYEPNIWEYTGQYHIESKEENTISELLSNTFNNYFIISFLVRNGVILS